MHKINTSIDKYTREVVYVAFIKHFLSFLPQHFQVNDEIYFPHFNAKKYFMQKFSTHLGSSVPGIDYGFAVTQTRIKCFLARDEFFSLLIINE